MKTAIILAVSVLGLGAFLSEPEKPPTLCNWIVEAALNGGPMTPAEAARCYRVAVRKINERAVAYARSR